MGKRETRKTFATPPAAALLLVALILAGACSGETNGAAGGAGGSREGSGSGGVATPAATPGPETTSDEPPEITLGEEPGDRPEAILRLEGGPRTIFSGLCTVGGQENVLSGRVPKRFTFDLDGSDLSCRIEKRDQNRGALKVVLTVGDTTRSVQQTNSPGAAMNVSYRGG